MQLLVVHATLLLVFPVARCPLPAPAASLVAGPHRDVTPDSAFANGPACGGRRRGAGRAGQQAAPPASFTRSCPASGGVLLRAVSAKTAEVRLIPGPNPRNPTGSRARRPPSALLHAALRRCARRRPISGARARTPPSSRRPSRAVGAAVSVRRTVDHGQRPTAPARAALRCAAASTRNSRFRCPRRALQRAPDGVQFCPSSANPCAPACSWLPLTCSAPRPRSPPPALVITGTSVRQTWFGGRRST